MDKFPQINSFKYPQQINVRVDDETKALYRFVKENGFDAAEIFRADGRNGLVRAKQFILSSKPA